MADDKVLLHRVRFTGNRTNLESIVVPKVGRVFVGDIFEVPAEVAERYATELPSRDGMKSDFQLYGSPEWVAVEDLGERRDKIAERLARKHDNADEADPEPEPVAEAAPEPEPEPESSENASDDKPKGGRRRKQAED